ncbi:PD-(D/E)XK nuclease family protein, partial [Thermodesulforhabdus norvegica]
WEEQVRRWHEQDKKWEEQEKRWEEQNRRWEENQKVIHKILNRLEALDRKFDSTIGALGARWGLYTEQSFRNALKGILEEFFNVEVVGVTEYDEEGEVFGRPDQIELDLIIKDGVLIICEIKSSMSKADMYLFERKARFYEKRHGKKAHKLIVISPMVDKKAREVADRLGIEVYSYAEEAGEALSEL